MITAHHQFPLQLRNDLLNLNLLTIETIFNNKRKGSWVIKVKKENNEFAILKWCHPSSSQELKKQFQKEQAFYVNNIEKIYLPRLYLTTPNCLLIEYIESVSLRQFLLQVNDKKTTDLSNVLNTVLEKVKLLNVRSDSCTLDLVDTASQLTIVWKKLFLSRPMNTQRTKVEQSLSEQLSPYLGFIVNQLFLRLLKQIYNKQSRNSCSIIHGDFHSNNILVSEDNNVFFVDFENIKAQQFWMLDMLYLLPMISKILQNKKQKKVFQNTLLNFELFSNKEEKKLFFKCLNMMKFAIFFNRCFNKQAT